MTLTDVYNSSTSITPYKYDYTVTGNATIQLTGSSGTTNNGYNYTAFGATVTTS